MFLTHVCNCYAFHTARFEYMQQNGQNHPLLHLHAHYVRQKPSLSALANTDSSLDSTVETRNLCLTERYEDCIVYLLSRVHTCNSFSFFFFFFFFVLFIFIYLFILLLFFFFCFVCIRALRRFQQSFSHIATVSGCDQKLNAHFKSAALLKYHIPDIPRHLT